MKTTSRNLQRLPSGPQLDRLLGAADEPFARSRPRIQGNTSKALSRIISAGFDAPDRAALEHAEKKDRAQRAAILRHPSASYRDLRRAGKLLDAAVASRIDSFNTLVAAPHVDGRPERHLLNEPYLIWSNVDLQDEDIVPANSRAKFAVRSEDGGPNDLKYVRFHYWWRNERDTAAVVNVNGYVIFKGEWTYGVGSGLFWGDRWVKLNMRGSLGITEWWKDPPTSVPFQGSQIANVLSIHVDDSGFGAVGAVDKQPVFRGVDLSFSTFIVPAQEIAIFTVDAQVTLETGDDDSLATADFATGDFHVGSPAVLVTVF